MAPFLLWVTAILTMTPTVRCVASTCRIAGYSLRKELFLSYSCGQCFFFTYLQSDKVYTKSYAIERCPTGVLICDKSDLAAKTGSNDERIWMSVCNCSTHENIYNLQEYSRNSVPLDQLRMEPKLPMNFLDMTSKCCGAARDCCNIMLQVNHTASEENETANYCPSTWDGWQCFQPTEPGRLVQGTCPDYTYGWTTTNQLTGNKYYSLKQCEKDGRWGKNNRSNTEWTDYRKCATSKLNEEVIKHFVGIGAFAASVIAVIPAIIIFSVYRTLQVDRITIHKHLLFSFLLTGILYIFNNTFFVADDAYGAPLVEANHISCRILFLIQLRYLRLANYMWMLCEGLYLYKFLFDAFAEKRSLAVYYLLGWVFPAVPTCIYAGLRAQLDNDKCWIISNIDWIEWFTFGPCILSLALNFFLMINIMRVLITKLRHTPANEPAQYRKAVRATLVLLPVFGLHFFITIYRMGHVVWYEIVNKLLDGLQGFIVAIIICYTHGEVIDLLKKTWRTYRMQQTCEREMRRSKKSFFMEHESTIQTEKTLL